MKDAPVDDMPVETMQASEFNGNGHRQLPAKEFGRLLERVMEVSYLSSPREELPESITNRLSVSKADGLNFSFPNGDHNEVEYNRAEFLVSQSGEPAPNSNGWLAQAYFVNHWGQRRIVFRADRSIKTLTTRPGSDSSVRWNQKERSLEPTEIKELKEVLKTMEKTLARRKTLAERLKAPIQRYRRRRRRIGRLVLDRA